MAKSPDDEYMEQLESENAALKKQVAQLGIENSHLCVANGELKAQAKVKVLTDALERISKMAGGCYSEWAAKALATVKGVKYMTLEQRFIRQVIQDLPQIMDSEERERTVIEFINGLSNCEFLSRLSEELQCVEWDKES